MNGKSLSRKMLFCEKIKVKLNYDFNVPFPSFQVGSVMTETISVGDLKVKVFEFCGFE